MYFKGKLFAKLSYKQLGYINFGYSVVPTNKFLNRPHIWLLIGVGLCQSKSNITFRLFFLDMFQVYIMIDVTVFLAIVVFYTGSLLTQRTVSMRYLIMISCGVFVRASI